MKKALILTWEGYKDYEAVYPYYRLLEEDYEVDVMSNTLGKVKGILGGAIPCNRHIDSLDTPSSISNILANYDLLIIPGGVNSLEKLRLHQGAVQLVEEWCKAGKLIGSICSGAQLLITAKVVAGRKITAYYSMEQDCVECRSNFYRCTCCCRW